MHTHLVPEPQVLGQLAADTSPAHVVLLVIGVGIAVAAFVLFVAAVVSILRSPRLTTTGRMLWLLVAVVAQFVGPIAWFVWGRHITGSSLYVD